MNELIEKLSSYVESQYGEEKHIKAIFEQKGIIKQISEESKEEIDSNKMNVKSEINSSMNELHISDDKIISKSSDILNSNKNSQKESKDNGIIDKYQLNHKNGNKTVNHELELKKVKQEYSRNNMIYRP